MKKKAFFLAVVLSFPMPAMADSEILYCQGMVCSTTPFDQSKFANFDVKNDKGEVVTSIYAHVDYVPSQTSNIDPQCANCSIVKQPISVQEKAIEVVNNFETATAFVQNSVQNLTSTKISTTIVDTRTVTIAETSTAHVDYSKIDWQTIDWTTFNWEDFLAWLTAYIEDLLAVKP